MSAAEQRLVEAYTATMRARDFRWAHHRTYSANALILAHMRRVAEICAACPVVEIQLLKELERYIENRGATLAIQIAKGASRD